ncbi:MAG: hypothetical protein LR005_02575 [Candidatus Pacebacteria bacterium]|nr:hypothetical protein [Candidatus Paceibacterota bacterium]
MKKLIEIDGVQYYFQHQIEKLGVYKNPEGKKFIMVDEKIVEIKIIPAIGMAAVYSKTIRSIQRVSEYLSLVTLTGGVSGFIWIKGKHFLSPETQPNLSITNYINGHIQNYTFPLNS